MAAIVDSSEGEEDLLGQARTELHNAAEWWKQGNVGRGKVGSRRGAGMALRYWLQGRSAGPYGTSFMHHLNAAADDAELPEAVRFSAWRLAARKPPENGWPVPVAPGLTPMMDAQLILEWCGQEVE